MDRKWKIPVLLTFAVLAVPITVLLSLPPRGETVLGATSVSPTPLATK